MCSSVELVHHPVIRCVVLSDGNVVRRDDGRMVSRHVSVRPSGISGILIYKFPPRYVMYVCRVIYPVQSSPVQISDGGEKQLIKLGARYNHELELKHALSYTAPPCLVAHSSGLCLIRFVIHPLFHFFPAWCMG